MCVPQARMPLANPPKLAGVGGIPANRFVVGRAAELQVVGAVGPPGGTVATSFIVTDVDAAGVSGLLTKSRLAEKLCVPFADIGHVQHAIICSSTSKT